MPRVGWTKCGVCGNPESSVTENSAGTLSLACHKCQFSGYAKAGTKAARLVRAAMTPDEETDSGPTRAKPEPPMQKPGTEPPGEMKPVPKGIRSAFNLMDL